MTKVLQNFLIGVGLDTEKYDKGAKNVESSLGRMRTLVGFTGTAISGAFGLAGTAAVNAGKRVLDFNNAAEKLKTPTDYVWNYGRALAALGGNAEEAITSISSLEARLAEMREGGTGVMPGEIDLQHAGVDVGFLRRPGLTGGDLLRELAAQMPALNTDEQRRVQEILNLSDIVMLSIKDGVESFDAGIARAGELYGEFGRATDAAREYVRAVAELNTQFAGINETLAEKMLPAITGILDSVGGFIERNREGIDSTIGAAAENPGSTAAVASGAALAAPWAWRAARAVGFRAIPYAGLAYGAYEGLKDEPIGDWWQQSKDSVRDTWRSWTGQDDYSHLPDAPYGSEVPIVAPGSIESLPPTYGDYLPMNVDNYHEGDPRRLVESATSGFVSPYEIYGGGEISNSEAASANPDVIMVQVQREQADRPLTTPRINVENHLEVQMEMDGRAVDTRVIDVIERRERDTMDDIYSSVDR